MNKFLSEWKQRELLCPAIASSPPPAPLSSSTFPGFLQFGASGLTATACDAFESRCSNLTAATPTDGTISQFPSTTSALLAAALAQQQNNNNSSACTQISAEDQLGAFLRAAVAANSSAAAAAAANVNTTHHQNGLSGDSSGGASASTDAGGVGPPDANSQSSHQHLTNSLASAVAGNPFLSQPPHQSAFQLVRSAHQVVPHSLLQPNPLLQQQHSPQNPPPEIRIHQPQPVPQEVTTSQHMAAAAAALYPQLMCQALLDRLGPSVLRSHMSAAKPIPNNERMDLARFRVKEPQEWAMDDVVAWMLDVAKRHQIPFENFQMHKFATCTGPLLMLMNEQSFKERDPAYGSLLFNEFRKLLNDDSFVDDWMRAYKASEEDVKPSTSALQAPKLEVHQSMQNTSLSIPQGSVTTLNGFRGSVADLMAATSPLSPLLHSMQQQQHALAAAAAAHLEPQPGPSSAPLQPHATYTLLQHPSAARQQEMARSPGGCGNPDAFPASVASTSTNCDDDGDDAIYHGVNSKIRKNKDGRPRKRSQHTKGNKLWEFIRDALKDPTTCPSVVRWEDPVQGVFRIVESEKLARLWGDRKNNQKMTYEKLSRAMRTYYEKQILVPVPKTGLYPKKLVYKFGPGAHGWSAPPDLVAAAVAANLMEEHSHHF